MIEQLIIGIIFILALAYLFQIVRKNFNMKTTSVCVKGCGTCSASEVKSTQAKKAEQKVLQA